MIGSDLSYFKILDKVGEGGMGEVYRAKDTKLGREVALKVLPDVFSRDVERMARFEREAHVLASLNHPNIAAIYGLEEGGGRRALVMELVEGETLKERIDRGPLPLGEALRVARQIAVALETAHEKGIVHRDLKPANVKLTAEGTVKVLDFGLAKALEEEGPLPEMGSSPTLTANATREGVILGTAAYMSPEQAGGETVDRRSDIFSFGVVLAEMLTGRQQFAGKSVSHTLAAVLHKEPEWEELPREVPPRIVELLRRCLRKDPKSRLQAIGDARVVIDEYLEDPAGFAAPAAATTAPAWRRALPWALFAVATAAAAVVLWMSPAPPPPKPLPLTRLEVAVGDEPLYLDLGSSTVLSPDGRDLAYVAGAGSETALYLRPLDQLKATRIVAGSLDQPYHPFFSPDGQWLGYATPGELRKVPISGGTPITLCKVNRSRGASWGPDGTIVFAQGPDTGLFRVPASGGEAQPLTTLAEGETSHRWPQVLPGGKAVLFTSRATGGGDYDDANLEVVELASGQRKVVHRGGSYGRYVPTGYLVYVNEGTLFAAPFDLDRLEVTGPAAPVVQGMAANPGEGGAQYSFSDTGTLAYASGEGVVARYPVLWVGRDGGTTSLWQEPGTYGSPRLSPDGHRLALSVGRDNNWDVWVYDLDREVATRLTFDEGYDGDQVWSPDGKYLAFASDRDGAGDLYRKRADGSGEVERLTQVGKSIAPTSWSPDGRYLAGTAIGQSYDLWTLDLEGGGEPETYLSTPFAEWYPAFSPDGRWLAYASNESGRFEVYVRPFPAGGGKWQVSDGGGGFPVWVKGGRELVFRSDDGLMASSVEAAGDTFRAGKPRRLVEGTFRGGIAGMSVGAYTFPDFDATADGQRFVFFPAQAVNEGGPHVILVQSWFGELRRMVGSQP